MKMNYFNLIVGVMIILEIIFLPSIKIGTAIALGILAVLNLIIGFNLPKKYLDKKYETKSKIEDNPFR
jgi:hypothetical protein